MAVDPNGYCMQCGTFRGQVAQQPVSGTPYPPQQPQPGGYGYPGAAPASAAPASGGAWPGPASAPPVSGYPYSGPPVSGPGYPQSAPPTQQRRSWVGALIAGSAVLVVLVAAIVVLAIVRSGNKHEANGPTPPPTNGPSAGPSAAIDTCLVGTWQATSEKQTQDIPDIGPVQMTGHGQVSHIHPDGTEEDDYSQATPYTGSYSGHSLTMTVTGTVSGKITTSNGTLSFHNITASGSITWKVDGTQVGSAIPLEMSSDPVQYTCTGKTATEHTEHYDVTLTKLSDSP
jgi:hypothetical protein